MNPTLPRAAGSNHEAAGFTFKQASFRQLIDGSNRPHDLGLGDFKNTGAAQMLAEHKAGSPQYDEDIPGEIRRMHCSLAPQGDEPFTQVVARHLSM